MRNAILPLFLAIAAAAFASEQAQLPVVEGHVRREPVLPASLPDYELQSLDIQKEIVFHVGNQTVIGRVPVLVYVPVTRAGRSSAVDRLVEARALLVRSAASQQVTTADLAALRDLIEQSLSDLRSDAPSAKPVVSK